MEKEKLEIAKLKLEVLRLLIQIPLTSIALIVIIDKLIN